MARDRIRYHTAGVTDIAAPVDTGIGIDALLPKARERHADTVIMTWNWREVARDESRARSIMPETQEHDHALVGVVAYHPGKAFGFVVALMKSGKRSICRIEVAHQSLHAAV